MTGVQTCALPIYFVCKTAADVLQNPGTVLTGTCIGTQLKTYRLALACTGEYAVAVCSPSAPTVPLTASAMLTSVNRVTGVYEAVITCYEDKPDG